MRMRGSDTTTMPTESQATAPLGRLRLMQLISPTLPIGGFTYSQGIEWAVEQGWISDEASLGDWLADLIDTSLAQVEIPVLARLYRARTVCGPYPYAAVCTTAYAEIVTAA